MENQKLVRRAAMKNLFVIAIIALMMTTALAYATDTPQVQGEYIEARSVSVYVGACHFGAEYVEGGKEATLIWNIHSGSWNNVPLNGLTVIAVVSAKKNLALDTKTRKSVLYIDSKATMTQRTAITSLLMTKHADVIGKVVATQTSPITFKKNDTKYDVTVGKVLALSAHRYPCAKCTQPHQIWYEPLTKIKNAIVGKSKIYRYKDGILPVNWQQGEEINNIFVGSFLIQ